ncbi:hypothetical protein QAD02_016092 [Eretmocerus hayati]|uniref:Uncharacterized protein n=1 Tax=Eretmocerus hayati TaxID=131215 RepID=A0ACC2P9N1_9HYME|nr:hypothetical protein QAD02_016092 [Eretmocerus hayati]
MEDTFSLSGSGTSSVLLINKNRVIDLIPGKRYVLGLVGLETSYSFPNIDERNNKLHVGGQVVELPTGSYEIGDIEREFEKKLKKKNIEISIKPNNNTLCSVIQCNRDIDLRPEDSIGRTLGFSKQVLKADKTYESDSPVNILRVNVIRVECSITTGAYINDQLTHTIHELFPVVPPGYKMIEKPTQPINYRIQAKDQIKVVQVSIVDQNGDPIDFRGKLISVRLHVKTIN